MRSDLDTTSDPFRDRDLPGLMMRAAAKRFEIWLPSKKPLSLTVDFISESHA